MMPRSADGWAVGVVIPARNEESSIERCVHSVRAAHRRCPRSRHLWVVVVADACTDRTAALARRALDDQGCVIELDAGAVGLARGAGASAALQHFTAVDRQRTWLANTDADTSVAADWLATQLELAQQGVAATAGVVSLALGAKVPRAAYRLFRQHYRIEADGTHRHVHAANLGVRADAYLDVGGWSGLAVSEDHCLWGRLVGAGWPVRASARIIVRTSPRLQGRATGGFADTLRALVEAEVA